MNKKYFIIGMFLFLFLISFASAKTYKQETNIDLKISTNESGCVITIDYPNSTAMISEQFMTDGIGYSNYTIDSSLTSSLGEYFYYSNCSEIENSFMITSTGNSQTTAQGLGSLAYLVLMICLTAILIFGGFKLIETENLWVLAIFFFFLSVIFLVYDSWLAYSYQIKFVGADAAVGVPEKLFFGFFALFIIGLIVAVILLFKKIPQIIKAIRKMKAEKEDDWNEGGYE